ncbi:hypothetical protein AVEN_240255-1 [Araneus ventricosus]|uniref:Uncharacterized protein n=1 Tax=Araneus ventricosus TaxID=182803 RepID=A0A4Y2PJ30_ARAVE|nr:hypothetical protein AVEN_240255-1 [Araneus ventricosus]
MAMFNACHTSFVRNSRYSPRSEQEESMWLVGSCICCLHYAVNSSHIKGGRARRRQHRSLSAPRDFCHTTLWNSTDHSPQEHRTTGFSKEQSFQKVVCSTMSQVNR